METFYQILKMIFVLFFSIGQLILPKPRGGDFPPSAAVEPGDPAQYLQITANDTGFDTWQPQEERGGYRYGPSMILNTDGSVDVWSASTGPGDIIDMVTCLLDMNCRSGAPLRSSASAGSRLFLEKRLPTT